jgi:hypothetical protein
MRVTESSFSRRSWSTPRARVPGVRKCNDTAAVTLAGNADDRGSPRHGRVMNPGSEPPSV